MHSGMFYRRVSSLTNRLAGEGTSTEEHEAEGVRAESYGGYPAPYPAGYPDASFGIHQKLDAIVSMFNEHKAESRAENSQLKEQIGSLGSGVQTQAKT